MNNEEAKFIHDVDCFRYAMDESSPDHYRKAVMSISNNPMIEMARFPLRLGLSRVPVGSRTWYHGSFYAIFDFDDRHLRLFGPCNPDDINEFLPEAKIVTIDLIAEQNTMYRCINHLIDERLEKLDRQASGWPVTEVELLEWREQTQENIRLTECMLRGKRRRLVYRPVSPNKKDSQKKVAHTDQSPNHSQSGQTL